MGLVVLILFTGSEKIVAGSLQESVVSSDVRVLLSPRLQETEGPGLCPSLSGEIPPLRVLHLRSEVLHITPMKPVSPIQITRARLALADSTALEATPSVGSRRI